MFVRLHLSRRYLGVLGWACHSSYRKKCKIGGLPSRLAWGKIDTLFPKITRRLEV
jgi:hypothetical protein